MVETVVIGAGITGLAFASFYKKPYVILEKEKQAGGLCSSIKVKGYTFDYSGHFLHLHHNETKQLIKKLLQNNFLAVKRDSWVYSNKAIVRYPFQANLFNLPAEVKRECVLEFIAKPEYKKAATDFYTWSIATFGKGITKHFMRPYNEKLWTVPADKLTTEWVAPFVPRPTLEEVINGAFSDQTKGFGYNVEFFYPKTGGIQSLINAFTEKIKRIEYSTTTARIDLINRIVETHSGKKYNFDKLVSTQPLPQLLNQIENLPENIKNAKDNLDWNKVVCLNLGIKRGKGKQNLLNGANWIYFPGKEFPFYRVGAYSNAAPSMAPKGCDSLYIEISRRPDDLIKPSIASIVAKLKSANLIDSSDKIETATWLEMPYAYIIYDTYRPNALRIIQQFLKSREIYSIGRYGAWKYSFMEESILDAKKLALEI